MFQEFANASRVGEPKRHDSITSEDDLLSPLILQQLVYGWIERGLPKFRTSRSTVRQHARTHSSGKGRNNNKDTDKDKDKEKIKDADKPIYEQEYFQKHVYMMREKMLEMFQQSGTIPIKDKKMMEVELHTELKELRATFRSIKAQRKKLYMDNNELHRRIERIHDDALVALKVDPSVEGERSAEKTARGTQETP